MSPEMARYFAAGHGQGLRTGLNVAGGTLVVGVVIGYLAGNGALAGAGRRAAARSVREEEDED